MHPTRSRPPLPRPQALYIIDLDKSSQFAALSIIDRANERRELLVQPHKAFTTTFEQVRVHAGGKGVPGRSRLLCTPQTPG